MSCANCKYSDEMVHTNLPPIYRCTITNEFHLALDGCDVEFAHEYIDKHTLRKLYEGLDDDDWKVFIRVIKANIDNMPTIEVEPKHAYVIVDEDGNMECSNCGSSNCFDNYCGTCGAKLIGERKDDGESC